jgi:acetoin utilization deacetylase AcuC-like enzyme
MAPTGWIFHEACLAHDAGASHPERPARLQAVGERVRQSGLAQHLASCPGRAASTADLALAHDPRYVEAVRRACAAGGGALDPDTTIGPASWEAALCATGGLLEACERVLAGEWSNAFVPVRPPGHHAEFGAAMGFCLFNSVAVAARALRQQHGIARVAILDWDVHHGNGTQHAFESDASVYYASLHKWPLYPGTGAASERGLGAGRGTTLNCPMEAGAGDAEWLEAFETLVLPALDGFRPEFVLVSAGFDGHRLDPLAGTNLTEDGYRRMTRGLLEVAARHARGRLVSVLEGGYHLEALAACAAAHLEELIGARACA